MALAEWTSDAIVGDDAATDFSSWSKPMSAPKPVALANRCSDVRVNEASPALEASDATAFELAPEDLHHLMRQLITRRGLILRVQPGRASTV